MTSDQSSGTEPECSCFVVANPWTYYGIVEPGGALEQNPECAVHGDVAYLAEEVARLRSDVEDFIAHMVAVDRGRIAGREVAAHLRDILRRPAGGER